MEKDNTLVQVTPDDIAFIEQELAKARKPTSVREITERLAFRKTASQRTQEVKIYDPGCVYQIGDSIYREYDEHLTVSSKTVEAFKGAVVLKVVQKVFYKSFNCEMLEVDYTGGGTFRKYIDYMKKSKTQVMLPSNVGGANCEPRVMGKDNDPRLTELPMTDKDLKALEKNLRTALMKSPAFFSWSDYWQLMANQPSIPEDKIKEMEAQIGAAKESAATGDLIKKFIGLEASHDLFDIHCLWLNHLLETKYKKEFLQVSPLEWGKWHLKSILNALPEKLPLSSETASLPEFETAEKIEVTPFHAFPLKVYLTWREILSGGVKIPKGFNKELSHSREYIFTDADENKNYTVFYYPQQGFFLGLKEFFAVNGIPQGTSMTLERKGPVHFHFWLKKSKKKISVAKLTHDPEKDLFADAGETATLALPNKIIYLERDTLLKMIGLYAERTDRNLRDLLILVFKNFSPPSTGYSLHFLRAYHLVDILKRTSQEDVEYTLLNSFEFTKSDKKKGIFYYQEAAALKEEILPGALPALMEEIPEEMPAEEIPVHEIQAQEALEDLAGLEAGIAEIGEKAKPEKPAAKKEKVFKKKKSRAEGEKAPRARKSERRVIEEKIEEEESEEEALIAVKAQEEEELEEAGAAAEATAEAPPAASPGATAEAAAEAKKGARKKEEAKKAEEAAGAFGSLLAEKLKAALTKKRQEEQKK